jgi:hypothetical protein
MAVNPWLLGLALIALGSKGKEGSGDPHRSPEPLPRPSNQKKPRKSFLDFFRKKPKEPRSPTSQTDPAVKFVIEELELAKSAPEWSEDAKLLLTGVQAALASSPHTEREKKGASLKGEAAYKTLVGLSEEERRNYCEKNVFPRLQDKVGSFNVKGLASGLAWVYLTLGGRDPEMIKTGQKYLGEKQTGVIDRATAEVIAKHAKKPLWLPILASYDVATVGMARAITPGQKKQFWREYCDEIMAYGPMQHTMSQKYREAFQAALSAFLRAILDEKQPIPSNRAAHHAYTYAFRSYGFPKISREDKEVKDFFQNVLSRFDDMMLFDIKTRLYNASIEEMRLYFGDKGLPPGAELEGFLR